MDDRRENDWMIVGGEGHDGSCVYGKKLDKDTIEAGTEIYSGSIYTQRFLSNQERTQRVCEPFLLLRSNHR